LRNLEKIGSSSELSQAWTIVVASAVGLGLGITGLPFYSMGQFLRPLSQQFGWGRAAISGAALCLSIGSVITSPIIGRVVDRIGVRRVALVSMPATALGFFALALNSGSLVAFYATWLAISFLGCGTTPVVWTRAISTWFNRQRGLALGVTLCGTGVAALIAPLILGRLIVRYGWRAGYVSEGVGILLLAWPLAWLFLRERGEVTGHASGGPLRPVTSRSGASRRDAFRSPNFWRLFIGIFIIAIVLSGLIVHLVPMMLDHGLTLAHATQIMSLLGFAIISGRLAIGFLLDRLPPALVALALLMLPAIACWLLVSGGSPLVATILLGLATGADTDLLPYLTSRCFGLRNYAELFGWLLSAASLGGGLGPVLAGRVHDASGNYDIALYAGLFMAITGALLIGTVKPDRVPARQQPVDANAVDNPVGAAQER